MVKVKKSRPAPLKTIKDFMRKLSKGMLIYEKNRILV